MKKIFNSIVLALRAEHCGSTAIEATILMPLMFGTFLMLLYFLFLVLAYIAYGNAANSIAHQMNMRQSGYRSAVSIYYNPESGHYVFPKIYSFKLSSGYQDRYAETLPGQFLTEDQVTCYPDNVYIRSGAYFAIDKSDLEGQLDMVADQFILPYVQVTHITIESSKPLDFNNGLSGTNVAVNAAIRVSIDFKVMNPLSTLNLLRTQNQYSSLITIKAIGYDVIA